MRAGTGEGEAVGGILVADPGGEVGQGGDAGCVGNGGTDVISSGEKMGIGLERAAAGHGDRGGGAAVDQEVVSGAEGCWAEVDVTKAKQTRRSRFILIGMMAISSSFSLSTPPCRACRLPFRSQKGAREGGRKRGVGGCNGDNILVLRP